MLCDGGTLMVVDFERAEFCDRQPLGSIDANGQNRKRKRGSSQKQGKDDFARELESAVEKATKYIARPPGRGR
ncbi:hypothetical protein Micbo1qcDRAFT_169890 [Microdochium bolleyi]|uniref:Uncharacterized protein n=1 Tax=Microdochium bolleyi TaxID=196109 RepID=A0A136IIS9_9PEZI|nr:hypothetical protein Micbo1qcDRAFT_169890 [Microdochium bolleyi]